MTKSNSCEFDDAMVSNKSGTLLEYARSLGVYVQIIVVCLPPSACTWCTEQMYPLYRSTVVPAVVVPVKHLCLVLKIMWNLRKLTRKFRNPTWYRGTRY